MSLKVDIYKRLGSFRLNVQLEAGDRPLALLGASGGGKSATLKCIAGVMTPDEGRIILDGQVLYDSARDINLPPQRRRIGYLFRDYALFPHMTVRQNIAASVRSRPDSARIADELLYRFRLDEAAELRPRQLTMGQRQRTALARMMASDPVALLLDEPLSTVDSYLRFEMEQELETFLDAFEGPIIWVSHDRGEIYRNCRYVCVLENGASQDLVTVEGLLAHPGTEEAARLSGCRNFIDAIPRENTVFLPKWGVTLRSAYPVPPFLWRIGIRERSVIISSPDRPNAFAVTVVRVIEDVDSTIVLLRPNGAAEDAPLLRMELDKDAWRMTPDKEQLTVSVGPQDILLLR